MALALAVLPFASCGGDDAGKADGASKTDVEFASAMTQHHAQTLQLFNMPQTLKMPSGSVEWTDPARTQRMEEISKLTRLLEDWDAPVPETGLDHASEGQHVEFDAGIEGVLSEEAVASVRRKRGPAFAEAWIEALLEHERGAVELARAEAENGSDAEAVRFAKQDVSRHQATTRTLERLAQG